MEARLQTVTSLEVNNQVLRSKMNYGILSRRFYTAPPPLYIFDQVLRGGEYDMFGQGSQGWLGCHMMVMKRIIASSRVCLVRETAGRVGALTCLGCLPAQLISLSPAKQERN